MREVVCLVLPALWFLSLCFVHPWTQLHSSMSQERERATSPGGERTTKSAGKDQGWVSVGSWRTRTVIICWEMFAELCSPRDGHRLRLDKCSVQVPANDAEVRGPSAGSTGDRETA